MKAAYQGTKASFSDISIERFFGSCVESIGKATFEDVFKSLDSGETELAAVPIENSLIGPIVENFDLFHRYDVKIIGELYLPIEHCLVGKNTCIEEIKKVYSHPKALAQCTKFFQTHPWIEAFVYFDTAGAAQEIAARSDPTLAAIGSRRTAEVYELDIIKANLEDHKNNTTRFLFLQKEGIAKLPASEKLMILSQLKERKCSLLITLKHIPGALSEVLQILALLRLNLTQIVSRPIWEKPFEYLFFIDILFSNDHDMSSILQAIQEKTETFKLLGIYAPSK